MKYLLVIICAVMFFLSCELGNPIDYEERNTKYWYTYEDFIEATPNECPNCGSTDIVLDTNQGSYCYAYCPNCGHLWKPDNIEEIKTIYEWLLEHYGMPTIIRESKIY